MRNDVIVKITAIICLTIINCVALINNIDSVLVSIISAIIGGIAGYEVNRLKLRGVKK